MMKWAKKTVLISRPCNVDVETCIYSQLSIYLHHAISSYIIKSVVNYQPLRGKSRSAKLVQLLSELSHPESQFNQ